MNLEWYYWCYYQLKIRPFLRTKIAINAHGLKSGKGGLAQIFAKILGRSRLSGQNCHGAQWEKNKILCHHQKIYNYKNILVNRYFNLTSTLRTLFSILKSQNSKRHSFLSLPLFFRK